jgi:hypothetical protein
MFYRFERRGSALSVIGFVEKQKKKKKKTAYRKTTKRTRATGATGAPNVGGAEIADNKIKWNFNRNYYGLYIDPTKKNGGATSELTAGKNPIAPPGCAYDTHA